MTDDPIIYSYKSIIIVSIPPREQDAVKDSLNMAYLGTKNCNKFINGKFVSIVKDKTLDAELTKAHQNMRRTQQLEIMVHLHKSGLKSFSMI